MATYTVSYRGKNGERIEEQFEAPDRNSLFKILADRKISAINVKDGAAPKRKKSSSQSKPISPAVIRSAVAGLIVVALAGALYLVISKDKAEEPVEEIKKSELIKEVQPAIVQKPVVEEAKVLTKEEKIQKEISDLERLYAGKEMPQGVKTHLYYLKHPSKVSLRPSGPHDYLRHASEREIAGVVLVEPGTFFAVEPEFGESFDNDFAAALVDRVDISKDDSEEVRQVKNEVEQLKHDIAKMCRDEGRKPSEILTEHAKMMYELGRYQMELEDQLNAIRKNPEYSDADVEDFFAAANEMLKNKGLPEMKTPNLTRRAFKLQKLREKAERKAAQSAESN